MVFLLSFIAIIPNKEKVMELINRSSIVRLILPLDPFWRQFTVLLYFRTYIPRQMRIFQLPDSVVLTLIPGKRLDGKAKSVSSSDKRTKGEVTK